MNNDVRRIAIVTGGSSGIGFEFAKLFSRDGYSVVIVARNEQQLINAKSEILGTYHFADVHIVSIDLSLQNSADVLYDKICCMGLEYVDVLVNSAGFGDYGMFKNSSRKRIDDMIELNIKALTDLCHRFADLMSCRRRGIIINLASAAAFQAGPYMSVYYATKAYVLSFSEALAYEMRPFGVTVTAVCPGPTISGFEAAGLNMGRSLLFKSTKPVSAASVANKAYRSSMKGHVHSYCGFVAKLAAFGSRFIPRNLAARISTAITGMPDF